jgi:dihydroorotate dehydrogenase
MPDWSYRTLFRPALFRLPAVRARDLTLGFMGALARLPLGSRVIDLLGHMRPPAELARTVGGISFSCPIGLGTGIDDDAKALSAMARFGFGFLEVGPVTTEPISPTRAIELLSDQEAIRHPDPPANLGVEMMDRRLACQQPIGIPLVVRVGCAPGAPSEKATADCIEVINRLAPHAAVFSLASTGLAGGTWTEPEWKDHVHSVVKAAGTRPVWLCVSPDLDHARAEALIQTAEDAGIAGILVQGSVRAADGGRLTGMPAREPALEMVRRLRGRFGQGVAIVSSGGVHEPEHALQLFAAGADLVQIDSGLVYGGPGLPKRVNDAVLFAAAMHEQKPAAIPPAETTWFWTLLMGVSMLLGGLLTLIIAATRVVLLYDETFVGLTREQLQAANPRLLSFMAHDRVTLSGTMMGVGAIYTLLSLYGIRSGLHWARQTILYSAGVGFFTFFLFLGYGYLDPLHAFVTAILFQFLLFALHSRLPARVETRPPNLREDRSWRWSQWGQLLFVLEGFGLLTAGLVISGVGVTRIFIHEDLTFMNTTPEALASISPRLLPLVAHDRASFGGMLISFGLAVELPALWGYRRGAWWLWWALLLGNAFAYGAAIGVHFAVGYTDWWHLLPAYTAIGIVALGSVLSYPYLCRTDHAESAAWQPYRTAGLSGSEATH